MILNGSTLLPLLAGKELDRDKADDETRADQGLLPKCRTGNAEIVVCDVRHHVRHERRTAQRKKECHRGTDELLHLDSPRAAYTPEDGSYDLDWLAARIPSAACMQRHIRMMPASRMSGKACRGGGIMKSFRIRIIRLPRDDAGRSIGHATFLRQKAGRSIPQWRTEARDG